MATTQHARVAYWSIGFFPYEWSIAQIWQRPSYIRQTKTIIRCVIKRIWTIYGWSPSILRTNRATARPDGLKTGISIENPVTKMSWLQSYTLNCGIAVSDLFDCPTELNLVAKEQTTNAPSSTGLSLQNRKLQLRQYSCHLPVRRFRAASHKP